MNYFTCVNCLNYFQEQREADLAKEKADDMESKAEVEREEARLAKVEAEKGALLGRLLEWAMLLDHIHPQLPTTNHHTPCTNLRPSLLPPHTALAVAQQARYVLY